MNLLITDATIITCDATRRVIERGAIAIDGSRIAAIGETDAHNCTNGWFTQRQTEPHHVGQGATKSDRYAVRS